MTARGPPSTAHAPTSTTRAPPPPSDAGPGPTISKDAYHAKKRSKAHCKRARELNSLERLAANQSPSVKSVVKKRRRAAKPLDVELVLEDIDLELQLDGEHDVGPEHEPVQTELSLDMQHLPVTKNAFIAKRDVVSDYKPMTKEEGIAQKLRYIEWDGK